MFFMGCGRQLWLSSLTNLTTPFPPEMFSQQVTSARVGLILDCGIFDETDYFLPHLWAWCTDFSLTFAQPCYDGLRSCPPVRLPATEFHCLSVHSSKGGPLLLFYLIQVPVLQKRCNLFVQVSGRRSAGWQEPTVPALCPVLFGLAIAAFFQEACAS